MAQAVGNIHRFGHSDEATVKSPSVPTCGYAERGSFVGWKDILGRSKRCEGTAKQVQTLICVRDQRTCCGSARVFLRESPREGTLNPLNTRLHGPPKGDTGDEKYVCCVSRSRMCVCPFSEKSRSEGVVALANCWISRIVEDFRL